GLELFDYLPDYAYTATITGSADPELLKQSGVHALIPLDGRQKMSLPLAQGRIPAAAVKIAGTVDVWIRFPGSFTAAQVAEGLRSANMEMLSKEWERYRILSVRV